MYQIKIFEGPNVSNAGVQGLDDQANEWFAQNPDIKLIQVTNRHHVMTIVYEVIVKKARAPYTPRIKKKDLDDDINSIET